MRYHCSFNRFILISLALLGLSVSSANAALTSGTDTTFGADSITIDSETGLEWLDLTYSTNISFNDMTGRLSEAGNDFEGWRYATKDEIDAFWISGGSDGPCDSSCAPTWMIPLMQLWGTTPVKWATPSGTFEECVAPCYANRFLTGEIDPDDSWDDGHMYGAMGVNPVYDPVIGSAYSTLWTPGDYFADPSYASALVRGGVPVTVVPVPAAIWLFGTALIGLVGYGKRKSKVPV